MSLAWAPPVTPSHLLDGFGIVWVLNTLQSLDLADGELPINQSEPKELSRIQGIGASGNYRYGIPNGIPKHIPNEWVEQSTMFLGCHVSSC